MEISYEWEKQRLSVRQKILCYPYYDLQDLLKLAIVFTEEIIDNYIWYSL